MPERDYRDAMSLDVTLLGSPRVLRDGVTVAFETRKAMALLAHLALTAHLRSRESLCELLYPGHDPDWPAVPCDARCPHYAAASAENGSTLGRVSQVERVWGVIVGG